MNQQELDRLLVQLSDTSHWLHCDEFAGTSQRLKNFVDELRVASSEAISADRIAFFLTRRGRCHRVDEAMIEALGVNDAHRIDLARGCDVFNSEELFGHGCHPSLFEVGTKNVVIVGLDVLSDTTLSRFCRYLRAWHTISSKVLVVVTEPGPCVDLLASVLGGHVVFRAVQKPLLSDRREDIPFELHHAALRCGSGLDRFSLDAIEWLLQQDWAEDVQSLDDVVRSTIASLNDGNAASRKHVMESIHRVDRRLAISSRYQHCSRLWARARDLECEIDQLTTALLQCPFFVADTVVTAVSPLAEDSPELDFFRIVSWAYVTLFERGDANLRCVDKLMVGVRCKPERIRQIKEQIGQLRTFLQHSLQYSSAHDRQTLIAAAGWFKETIGIYAPGRRNFEACTRAVLEHLIQAFEDVRQFLKRVNEDEFRDELILRQWRSMRETTWPKHRFDAVIERALANLGRDDLKPEVVSEQLLAQMQQRLKATKETVDREHILIAFAETQIANHYPEESPIKGSDLVELGVTPGPRIAELLEKIRTRFLEKREPKDVLLGFAKELIVRSLQENG